MSDIFKNILLIDNYDSFTYIIADYFKQFKCNVEIVRNDISPENASKDFDLLVLSPGPSRPKDSAYLLDYIDVYYSSKPILGICLGLHALVEYFGGTLKYINPIHGRSFIVNNDRKSIYTGINKEISVARYHSIGVDKVPEEFEVSGITNDNIIMSLRHRNLKIEGIQFHPESIMSINDRVGMNIFKNIVFKYFGHSN